MHKQENNTMYRYKYANNNGDQIIDIQQNTFTVVMQLNEKCIK
jgi:hypothetical protein